ncbi:MEDS domain-containing protein [Amycolatopsis sp. EV170708-02-1]|uniref:MEDS domain-containing protein n=1 Tax=Amycolatopsis sp. EV170708-02-1 TaxID=2919322 RepID=UPI001F0BF3B7|nr:MEDS domain-containing protein [Amycolatopsis sp. EV170708-02-1]UMP06785.1 MEDS domain-containing protein [Amycolatopsis sp. EV170708-02-1]
MCVWYDTDHEYQRLARLHFLAAVEQGQKITYLTNRTPPVVLSWLSLTGPELDALTRREQLVISSADEFYQAAGFESDRVISRLQAESNAATRAGYLGLHICADMTWALPELADSELFLAYERQVTALAATGELPTLTGFCYYDRRQLTNEHLEAVRQAHSKSLTAEQAEQREPLLRMTPLEGQCGLRLSGEIDRSNLAEFAATLESTYCDDDDFHLDVRELRYVDVATVRLLAHSAANLRNGYRFVLRSPGPIIRAILRNYGWDQLPSLTSVATEEAS